MCTAIAKGSCFGRNLDLEYGYLEQVVITPRRFPLHFRKSDTRNDHYSFVGVATVDQGYPLYYDAMNEKGLAMAGLDFPDNAYYPPLLDDMTNIAPFELIPWILSQCSTVRQAQKLLTQTHLADISYGEGFPQAPLHWMIADPTEAIVLEPTQQGLQQYDNPIGVLTNNPPFPFHIAHLGCYQHLQADVQHHNFPGLDLKPFGGGMGAIGLPGDFSSPSRFVKAAFVCSHSENTQSQDVTQFFHLLDTVTMPAGSIRVSGGRSEITRYSCCCDLKESIYYYVTYGNRRINAIKLHPTTENGSELIYFDMTNTQDIYFRN